MKKESKQGHQSLNKKIKIFAIPAMIFIAILAGLLLDPKDEHSILKELREKNGYLRTVEREEYEFYEDLVTRDAAEELTEEEKELQTKEMVNRANAEFLLGYQMGLCSPYSFESFKLNMENENTRRKLKKEKGEVFYGPEQFDLQTYYVYISGNLKLDMVAFIRDNADEQVQDGAREYFEDHREKYRMIKQIEYLLNENGKSEEKVLIYEDLSTLEKTDSQLFEFLYYGEKGDELEYTYREQSRTVTIKSVEYEKLTYQNNAERVMRDYITNVYLENWLREIGENFPVEFNF